MNATGYERNGLNDACNFWEDGAAMLAMLLSGRMLPSASRSSAYHFFLLWLLLFIMLLWWQGTALSFALSFSIIDLLNQARSAALCDFGGGGGGDGNLKW